VDIRVFAAFLQEIHAVRTATVTSAGLGNNHRRVGLQLELPVGHHAVTLAQARGDDGQIAGGRPDRDRKGPSRYCLDPLST
jgi:hypothetical protein